MRTSITALIRPSKWLWTLPATSTSRVLLKIPMVNLDYATIKYSPSGAQTWAARFDSTNSPSAIPVGLALDPSNNVFVTGSAITVKYNANGNQMWTAPYAGAAVATDTNGNICVVGYSTDFGTAKLSPAGSNLWTASAPSATGPALSQKLAIDGSGNIYVAGSTTGFCETNSCYVGLQLVKYDGNGNQLWTVEQGLGDGVATEVVGWSLDSSANAYVLANAPNMPCNSFKFSSNGSKVWTEVNPTGDAFSYAYGLALG